MRTKRNSSAIAVCPIRRKFIIANTQRITVYMTKPLAKSPMRPIRRFPNRLVFGAQKEKHYEPRIYIPENGYTNNTNLEQQYFCGFEMNLKRLEFTLTTTCNSQCIHCQANASPTRNEVMTIQDAHNYLTEAVAVSNLESFMVFGGEPMLYPEKATTIFQKANQLDIPSINMITNGAWGKNKENAEKLANKLKTAGLNKVDISIDAFHAQYIPVECPKNAALALLKAGIKNVNWNVAVVESTDAQNEHDKKTKEILKKLEPIGIDAHVFKVMPVGRAAKNLHEFFPHTPLAGPCEGEPIIDNALTNPGSVCIDPSGAVNICWNLAVGNAKQKPLSNIISEYDWRKNPTIKTLVEEGPMGLLSLRQAHDFKLQENYYINKCHLCTEIRKQRESKT